MVWLLCWPVHSLFFTVFFRKSCYPSTYKVTHHWQPTAVSSSYSQRQWTAGWVCQDVWVCILQRSAKHKKAKPDSLLGRYLTWKQKQKKFSKCFVVTNKFQHKKERALFLYTEVIMFCCISFPTIPGTTSLTPQTDLHQSCRHPVRSWGNQSFGSHLHNMTVSNGRLRIPRAGRYYLYAQVYFRYLTLSIDNYHSGSVSHQVVQCVYKKTAYARPIQLLKGVGTKCWSPDSENALHSIYQGGLFELRAGDEIFISVSSPTAVYAEDSSSYFGAFLFDLWGTSAVVVSFQGKGNCSCLRAPHGNHEEREAQGF